MARPSRCRKICFEPTYDSFIPEGISNGEKIILTLDEYEVIRLIDLNKLTHEQASKQMNISRTTVSEIYEMARYKIANSLVHGRPLLISGGNYQLCQGEQNCLQNCPKRKIHKQQIITKKGVNTMRIAVTYDNGNIFQHFGHTSQFKVYGRSRSPRECWPHAEGTQRAQRTPHGYSSRSARIKFAICAEKTLRYSAVALREASSIRH